MIEVTDIVKRYGQNTVLNKATFQIQEAQLTTILARIIHEEPRGEQELGV